MKNVVVIPARLESTRLPNKVLLDLGGKTIIQLVYENCIKAKNIFSVFIASDNDKIIKHCRSFTDNVIKTKKHKTGTDRIAEAVKIINCDNVINIQADEPFVDKELIEKLSIEFLDPTVNMVSAMHKINSYDELNNPNNVKVCVDYDKNALLFSRCPIPFSRDKYQPDILLNNYYKHIGVYGYKKKFLLELSNMRTSKLEKIEKLEQLRVLENGYKIRMIETTNITSGIDTIEDYKRAKKLILKKQKNEQ